MTETERPAARKVAGVCVVCRVDVHGDPIDHYISDSHRAKAHAWDKATHGTPRKKASAAE